MNSHSATASFQTILVVDIDRLLMKNNVLIVDYSLIITRHKLFVSLWQLHHTRFIWFIESTCPVNDISYIPTDVAHQSHSSCMPITLISELSETLLIQLLCTFAGHSRAQCYIIAYVALDDGLYSLRDGNVFERL